MNTREKFKRAVIEAIHGLPYEGDVSIDISDGLKQEIEDYQSNLPITIGRVMAALRNLEDSVFVIREFYDKFILTENWQLTKENGSEYTDDDQSDETIEHLLELID